MHKELVRQYVGRAIIRKSDSFLFVRVDDEPHWFLPGGRVEPGEGVCSAIVREIKEELNAEAVLGEFIGCIEHAWSSGSKDYYETGFFFTVAVTLPDQVMSNEARLEFQWISVDDFDVLDIRPSPVKRLLRFVAQGKSTPFWASTIDGNK